jgi:hypothetical protein
MAARSPASITQYVDVSGMKPKSPIVFTQVNNSINDQHFILKRRGLVLTDWFSAKSCTSGSWTTLGRYRVPGIHRCGLYTPALETGSCYIYAWATDASDFDVGIWKASTAAWVYASVTALHTSYLWRGFVVDFIPTDHTELEVRLGVRRVSGAGTIYVAGIVIYSA